VPFAINPKRLKFLSIGQRIKYYVQFIFVRFGLWCGFTNLDYHYIHGSKDRLKIGKGCSTANTMFNTISGTITLGDNTIFAHNCMVLTGVHRFYRGKRAKLNPDASIREVPDEGNDICFGSGCFIGGGSIILAGVNIGDNVIVGAGSVVTKDVPSNCFACGCPAKVVKYHDTNEL